ncbi:very short patch repair endonuclease [Flavobacterium saliperosum]|uniref:very short patch repair endonuclease n=1 Tax=Flavobacterium saliperosum TaxID=329186 RepID=UPI0021CD4E11|nr:very short patch repair endonuclease [Flavobacterium saliperosum]
MQRDKEVNEHLISSGWTVLRFWSSEIRKNTEAVLKLIEKEILIQSKKYNTS